MNAKNVDVTETELAILDVLWERGSATIREITDEIYETGTTGEYATVQKLLDRLSKKGYVSRDRKSFAHVFRPQVAREQLIGQGLESLAAKLCDGSFTPLLMHLADATKLSKKDRDALLKMIEGAEKKQSDRGVNHDSVARHHAFQRTRNHSTGNCRAGSCKVDSASRHCSYALAGGVAEVAMSKFLGDFDSWGTNFESVSSGRSDG